MTDFRVSGSSDGCAVPPETDLRHVPWEQHNVAGRPEYQEVQAQLDSTLIDWMTTTDDPGLKPGIPEPLDNPIQWPIPGKITEVTRR